LAARCGQLPPSEFIWTAWDLEKLHTDLKAILEQLRETKFDRHLKELEKIHGDLQEIL
jgi:hypothetical protein